MAGLLDQRGGEGGVFDDFVHGMSPKLGDFTNKYDQTESNFCYGWYFDKHLSKLGDLRKNKLGLHWNSSDNFVTLKRQGSFIVQVFAFDHQTWGT